MLLNAPNEIKFKKKNKTHLNEILILPVIANLADHFDVPSSTLCLTAFI